MTDKYGMDMRRKAHYYFDKLWKSKKMSRNEAYQFLKEKFGREVHIGESSPEECKEIIKVITS